MKILNLTVALGIFLSLVSCIKDEPLNAECDITAVTLDGNLLNREPLTKSTCMSITTKIFCMSYLFLKITKPCPVYHFFRKILYRVNVAKLCHRALHFFLPDADICIRLYLNHFLNSINQKGRNFYVSYY